MLWMLPTAVGTVSHCGGNPIALPTEWAKIVFLDHTSNQIIPMK